MSIVNVIWIIFMLLFIITIVSYSLMSNKTKKSDIDSKTKKSDRKKKNLSNKKSKKLNVPITVESNYDLVETESKSKLSNVVSSKSVGVENEKEESSIEIKSKEIPNVIIGSPVKIGEDLSFRSDYNIEEIELLKRFNTKNRGYVIQTLHGKVILNRWVKTKNVYDDILNEVKSNYSNDGVYLTYLVWNGEVIKTKMISKIK